MERLGNIEDLKNLRTLLTEGIFKPGRNIVKVCCGLPCSTLGSHKVAEALREEAEKSGIDINIVKTGCQGLCQKGPLLQIEPHGFLYLLQTWMKPSSS
jgi:NADH:ubiquinone oxidoreductase subunit E